MDDVRYLGTLCRRHPELMGERYRKTNRCVLCRRECTLKWRQTGQFKAYIAHANRVREEHISKHAAKDYGPADQALMRHTYELATAYRLLGIDCHVDHIVPLRGDNVCGLHVGINLQILEAKDNLRKGNRWS